VRVQGIVALILLGFVVAMATAGGFLLVRYGPQLISRPKPKEEEVEGEPIIEYVLPGPERGNGRPTTRRQPPPEPAGPNIEGVPVAAPVAYCIATGSPTAFNFALAKTFASLETLGRGAEFRVLLSRQESVVSLSEGYRQAGDEALRKTKDELLETLPGTTKRLSEAIQLAAGKLPVPRTIVAFCSQPIPEDDVDRAVEAAKAVGAIIVTIVLTNEGETVRNLKALSQRTGGKYIAHDPADFF
jgi:hypothetical protein